MRIPERILVFISAVFFLLAAVFFFAVALGWDPRTIVQPQLDWFVLKAHFEAGTVGLVALLLAIWAALAGSWGAGQEHWLVQESSLGRIQISFRAVEALVRRAAREVQGIKDVETAIGMNHDHRLRVRLMATVYPDLSIPEVSERLQHQVEEYLKKTVGLAAAVVEVAVRTVAGETRTARVE
ncbi:MAG: alkaline shock response membrane anchor protein AmaP [Firmicutes bacterium]|nr:alkaline shock response membrane anchor protein AmaP [Bacillota bacterium]